jgi:hypothetical protein
MAWDRGGFDRFRKPAGHYRNPTWKVDERRSRRFTVTFLKELLRISRKSQKALVDDTQSGQSRPTILFVKPDPIAPRRLGESSAPPKGSQARAGRWVAGVLVLVVAGVVASVRLRSRQESSPAVSTGSQESELVDSHLAESTGAPVQAQPRWGTDEVLRRLAAIGSMTLDPRERVRLIQELIRSADLTEPGCGAAFWDFAFGRLTPETGLEPVLDTLGHFWAIADRDAAWAFLTDPERTSTNPHDRLGDSQFLALKGLLLEWMRSDVAGALERARSFSQPVRRSGLMVHLYLEWLATAPNDALAEFPNETFQDGMGGLSTRILLLGIVQRQNPALGLKLFDAIPREAWTGVDDPEEVAQHLEWITNHPQLGATLIERLPEPIARPLVTRLVDAWTQVDPMAALEWLVDQSKFAQTGPDVLGYLFKRLAEVDPTSAVARFERLSSQDQSPWAPVLAAEWANRDPRSAVAWAQARWQQGMGSEALLRGTESWIKTDPVGAAAFIREILPTVTQPAEQLEFAQLWVTAEPSAGLDTLRSLVPTEALEAPAAACAELKIEGLAKAFLSFAEQGRGLSGMRTKLPGAVSFRAKQGPS